MFVELIIGSVIALNSEMFLLYLVYQLHNYELKQSKATGFGLFVPRPSSGSLPGLRKGQDLERFLQSVSMLITYLG
jgi:hypothetical protein